MVDVGLYFMYILLIVAVVLSIVFPILNMAKSPATIKNVAYSVGALLVLFGISYALSSSTVAPEWKAEGISEATSKLIGAGLILFYISMVLAILGLIFSEINKALK